MGKGSGGNTVTSGSSPNPNALANYENVSNQAAGVASNPYYYYSGDQVAGLSPDQLSGIGSIDNIASAMGDPSNTYGQAEPYINSAAGMTADAANAYGSLGNTLSALENPENTYGQAVPYLNAASSDISAGGSPITASDINGYMNPYLSEVGSTTSAEMNQNNAIQQQQLEGSAAASGALGGDRVGVAQSALANQQDLAENATLANINSTGYNTALGAAQTTNSQELQAGSLEGQLGQTAENAALSGLEAPISAASTVGSGLLSSGSQMGNLGALNQSAATGALNTALTGAESQLQAGSLEQQQQQNELNAAYGQWLGSVQYPFQDTSYLAGIQSDLGSLMGGSSSTTYPSPNSESEGLGNLIGGLGLAGSSGLFGGGNSTGWVTLPSSIAGSKRGGRIERASGGQSPMGGGQAGVGGLPGQDEIGDVTDATYVGQVPQLARGQGAPQPPTGGTQAPQAPSAQQAQQAQQQIAGFSSVPDAVKYIMNGGSGASLLGGGSSGNGSSSGFSDDFGGSTGFSSGDWQKRGGTVHRDDGGQVTGAVPEAPSAETMDDYQLLSQLAPGAPVQKIQYQPPQGVFKRGGLIAGFASGGTTGAQGMQGVSGMNLVTPGQAPPAAGSINYGGSNPAGTWSGVTLPSTPQAAGISMPTGTTGSGGANQSFSAPSTPGLSIPTSATGGNYANLTGLGTGQAINPETGVPNGYSAEIFRSSPYYISGTEASQGPTQGTLTAGDVAPSSSSSSGASNTAGQVLGGIGDALAIAGLVAALKRGGRVGYDTGGGLPTGDADPGIMMIAPDYQPPSGTVPSTSAAPAPTPTAAPASAPTPAPTPAPPPQAGLGNAQPVTAATPAPSGSGAVPSSALPMPPSPAPPPPAQQAGLGGTNTTPSPAAASQTAGIPTGAPTPSVPRGMRDNNPLNLGYAPGESGLDPSAPTDGSEARFASPTIGIAQSTQQLLRYQDSGVNTVAGIVTKWTGGQAPPQYITDAANALGVKPNDPIDLNDPQTMTRLQTAMWQHETPGGVDQKTLSTGIELGYSTYQRPKGQQYAQADNVATDASGGGGSSGGDALGRYSGLGGLFAVPQQVTTAAASADQSPNTPDVAPTTPMERMAESPWMALANAGFSMMAGTSPFFGVNVGQGMEAGSKYMQDMLPQQRARQQMQFDQGQQGVTNQQNQTRLQIAGGDQALQGQQNAINAVGTLPTIQNAAAGVELGAPGSDAVAPLFGRTAPNGGYAAGTQAPAPSAAAPSASSGDPAQMLPPVKIGTMSFPAQTPMDRMSSMAMYTGMGGIVGSAATQYYDQAQDAVKSGRFVNQNGQMVNVAGSVGAAAQGTSVTNQVNAESSAWGVMHDAMPALETSLTQLQELSTAAQAAPPNKYQSMIASAASTLTGVAQALNVTPDKAVTDYASAADLMRKINTQLAGNIAQSWGDRAYAALRAVQSAVPSGDLSSPQSFATVTRSLGQQLGLAKDLYDYGVQNRQADLSADPSNPYGWEDQFFQSHPPQMYASRVNPLPLQVTNGQISVSQLHPGFNYTVNGTVRQWTGSGFVPVDSLGNAGQ